MTPSGAPPTIDVLVFDGFDELDAVGPYEVLAAAGGDVRAVGPAVTPSPSVRAGNGLGVLVDGVLGERTPDVVVVPGGGWRDAGGGVRVLLDDGGVPEVLARLAGAGVVVASVCTGAFLLAEAGLLAGRPAVTNALACDDLAAWCVDVRPDARVVDAGPVLTSGGPLAGIDLALRLVERLLGEEAAARAAARIEHERRGPLVVADDARTVAR